MVRRRGAVSCRCLQLHGSPGAVVLLDPIKHSLNVSDSAMGLLTGFAFVSFYTISSLPIARLSDSYSRRNIIAIGLAFWSVMTAVSGFVGSFGQLALARMGVGIGEAAAAPAASR